MEKIIVANWKMNGTASFITEFFKNFLDNSSNRVIFCPPTPYLTIVRNHALFIGGQDCSYHNSGAFTGEVSATMLQDVGCQYVLVGHSERRLYHHESNETVKTKANQAQKAGLIPIICVGESKEVREEGKAIDFVKDQLIQSLPDKKEGFYIAYEPVWAIGTGLTATPDDISQMHQAIYEALHDKTAPILYGGSVNQDNAYKILALPKVSGVLVGGASLKYEVFNHIVAFSDASML